MSSKNYNSTERQPIIEEMEQLLSEIKQHVKYLKQANKTLKKIDADTERLEEYYLTDWLEDYNHFYSSGNSYEILSQDPIFNGLQEVHEEKVKLMKQIVKKIR